MQNNGWNFEHTYTNLPEIFYKKHNPDTPPNPRTVIFNKNLARELGLNPDTSCEKELAGTALPPGAKPICQAYAGYQFGHFAMLGDGRAVLLGEQIAPDGRRFDIQLKGSGPTPFSRGGDGYAALLPMLREYIISEAIFHLGIPTTRSLAVVLTGRPVLREKALPGAVLTRVAASHIRVGTFNFASAFGTADDTRALADYCIWRHFPWISRSCEQCDAVFPEIDSQNRYILFLREVAARQAALIASWQHVGFIHGVMNTDNMSVCGETIDYGPCAFMDAYDPGTVFSSIDAGGRYAYKNQPGIGAWNLSRFAEALLPLFHENKNKAIELAQKEIEIYYECYKKHWLDGMRAKLGIANESPGDETLITELLDLMQKHKLDFTGTFRALARSIEGQISNCPDKASVKDNSFRLALLPKTPDFTVWQEKWLARLGKADPQHASTIMDKNNPAVIPRNHRVEEALAAAGQGDYSVMYDLLAALRNPYEESDMYSLPPVRGGCDYKTFCGT